MGENNKLSEEQNQVDLNQLFNGLQNQMHTKLSTIRDGVSHGTTVGNASELKWISLFKDYLPTRYSVDSGHVLDSQVNQSEQIDIVIYDRHYSPFFFNEDGVKYFPAESVYTVLEVKQDLTKGDIEYAGNKAASVRQLHRTSAPIIHLGGPHRPREHYNILAGILTLESGWSPPLGESFTQSITGLTPECRLDFGCALNSGSFRVRYNENPPYSIETSNSENSLIFFFLTLLSRLQELGTAPAMDISAYEQALNR